MVRNLLALGQARLARKLNRLPKAAETAVRAGMEEAAERVAKMARHLVPVDDGTLRDSIGWSWGDPPKGSIVLGLLKKRGRGRSNTNAGLKITIYAGNSEAFYARWVEFGTEAHINGGLFAGTKNPGTSAQPFFYPAWRAEKKSARRTVSKVIRQEARKIAAS